MTDLDIKALLAARVAAERRLEKLTAAIDALRELCDHDFAPSGNDSHYNYQRCSRCGFEEKAP